MMSMNFDDNKKIGIGLTVLGILFTFLGIMFFFDRGFLALGNLAFLCGITISIGIKNTVAFFISKGKQKASAFYFLGFFLVIMGWGFVGTCSEFYGVFLLFKNFVPNLLGWAVHMPVIGDLIRKIGLSEYSNSKKRMPV
mmetsp:Transcript_1460/g.1531  ORF Transcript_1460/g.1531 Transcript_1460/m.1531 type:complete len:139 (-) Transcript_1460:207-623(-)